VEIGIIFKSLFYVCVCVCMYVNVCIYMFLSYIDAQFVRKEKKRPILKYLINKFSRGRTQIFNTDNIRSPKFDTVLIRCSTHCLLF